MKIKRCASCGDDCPVLIRAEVLEQVGRWLSQKLNWLCIDCFTLILIRVKRRIEEFKKADG